MNTVVTLTDVNAQIGKGGVFYLLNARQLQITGSSFTNFYAKDSGSFLYSTAVDLDLDITTTTFDCLTTPWTDLSPSLSVPTNSIGGSFYVSGATGGVTSSTNIF